MNLLIFRLKSYSAKIIKNIDTNIFRVKKPIFFFISILSGLCLFILTLNFVVYITFLNADFYEKLLSDDKIVIFVDSFLKNESDSLNISPDIIQDNLFAITRGVVNYIKGRENLLPDIRLEGEPISLKLLGDFEDNKTQNQIDRINLSTVLLFSKKTPLYDNLTTLRGIYKCFKSIFSVVLLFFVLLLILMLIMGERDKKPVVYWKVMVYFSGLLCILSALAILICYKIKLQEIMHVFFIKLNIPQEILTNMIQVLSLYTGKALSYIIFYLSLLSFLTGLIPIFVSFVLKTVLPYRPKKDEKPHSTSFFKNSLLFFIFVLITIYLIQKTSTLKSEYKDMVFTSPVVKTISPH